MERPEPHGLSASPQRVAIGLGAAFSRDDAKAAGYIQVPHLVVDALEASRKSYLLGSWRAAAKRLWQIEQDWKKSERRKLGLPRLDPKPGNFKAGLRPDRHPKTLERHLRELEELSLLERNAVRGCPRRGPGTRVRYWLVHALNLTPAAALAAPDGPPPARPREPQETAEPPQRGPPDDPDGPRSAGETLRRHLENRPQD